MTWGNEAPSTLGDRGSKLWAEVVKLKPSIGPGERVLLEEACRLSDRLDHFAQLIDGDERQWCQVRFIESVQEYEIVLDKAVAEARAHTTALAGIVKSLAIPEPTVAAGGKSKLELLLGGVG